MRINVNDLGICTKMVPFGNRIEMFQEKTGKVLIGQESHLLYISCEAYVFKRRGFVLVYRDENNRYGLMTLKPINSEGYWEISPSNGEWVPNPDAEWHISLWDETTIDRISAYETIYGLDSGWFGAYGVKTKFDYMGRFKSDDYWIPQVP